MPDQQSPPLDPRQVQRIEGVHRGFLYQHLYAVGCLLLAGKSSASSIVVERDEDIEIIGGTDRLYVQVKTRSRPIVPSDIEDVLLRFDALRAEHQDGCRAGGAIFVIVMNQPPGPLLSDRLKNSGIPKDVHLVWPRQAVPAPVSQLPPAWPDIAAASTWCTQAAEKLPFAALTPESLVWKLAGHVLLASSGSAPYSDHAFDIGNLPALFEQLLVQLQEFPAPPIPYRPQHEEPGLDSDARVRIVCGFSGSGKTAWASQAALHDGQQCAYFDVGDLPGPAMAASLVRELAAGIIGKASESVRQVLLPGATGIESLGALDIHLGQQGRGPIVVLDNAHRVPFENLRAVIEATAHIRFVLLCQPLGSVQEIEAWTGLNRESLRGWDADTIAVEVVAAGAVGSATSIQRLKAITAGLPLYVRSAARIAASEYGGNIGHLCDAIEAQTHTIETAQEIILSKLFEALPALTRDAIAILSLSDVPLRREEVGMMLKGSLNLSVVATNGIVRTLRPTGVIEIFGTEHLKIHDAMRVLGKLHFEAFGPEIAKRARETLKEIVFESVGGRLDTSRLSLYIRTLVALGDIKTLVDLAGSELFHEMGIGGEIWASLEVAAASTDIDPEQRFWALDGLAFADLKAGHSARLPQRLEAMDALLSVHTLGDDERLAYLMKHMFYQSKLGNIEEVNASIVSIAEAISDKPAHHRIFRYNAAHALWELGQYGTVVEIMKEVISEYYELLGISPSQVFGRNPDVLWPLLKKSPSTRDDVKHLADSLELCAMALNNLGRDSGLLRIHAMKFFQLAGAPDSLVRVGQDLVDEFVVRHDYIGARDVAEKNVLPIVTEYKMIGRLTAVRSQYAVVLAYCGDHDGADAEMARLVPYAGGLTDRERWEFENQLALIAQLRDRPPAIDKPGKQAKIGRNAPCHCGSGLKFKKCHGK